MRQRVRSLLENPHTRIPTVWQYQGSKPRQDRYGPELIAWVIDAIANVTCYTLPRHYFDTRSKPTLIMSNGLLPSLFEHKRKRCGTAGQCARERLQKSCSGLKIKATSGD